MFSLSGSRAPKIPKNQTQTKIRRKPFKNQENQRSSQEQSQETFEKPKKAKVKQRQIMRKTLKNQENQRSSKEKTMENRQKTKKILDKPLKILENQRSSRENHRKTFETLRKSEVEPRKIIGKHFFLFFLIFIDFSMHVLHFECTVGRPLVRYDKV